MDDQSLCSHEKCTRIALPLSEPPYCPEHVPDVDEWFDSFNAKLDTSKMDEGQKQSMRAAGYIIYTHCSFESPAFTELYTDYKRKVDPDDTCQFASPDIVYFVLLAAAQGVIGNYSHEAIKSLFNDVVSSAKEKLSAVFDRVVSKLNYEALRKQRFPSQPPAECLGADYRIKLSKKYRLLVRIEKTDE